MNVAHRLKKLIEPSAVALVGASERPFSLGETTLKNLIDAGYEGKLYPINPKYDQIAGLPCYAGWAEIPEPVDCAIFCTPAHTVPGLLDEAGEAGVRAAVVFASGFAETGDEGRELQIALKQAADRWGIALCGPNCLGLINFPNRFTGYSAPMAFESSTGRISAVCQSGSIALALLNNGRGLQYRAIVSSGNEAVNSIEDYLEFFVKDSATDVVLAFVEGFRNIPKLREVASLARKKAKPIIVLKVGRSAAGRQAAVAHTGALAGADTVLDALLKQLGIIRVRDLDELLETALLFDRVRYPDGDQIGVIGISGGEIGLLADLAEDADLQMARLSTESVNALGEILPPYSTVANPLDAWTGDLGDRYANCLQVMAEDSNINLVAVSQDAQAGLSDQQASFYSNQARSLLNIYQNTEMPIVMFSNVSGGLHPDLQEIYDQGNIPVLQGTTESLRAIRHLIDFSHRRAQPEAQIESIDTPDTEGVAPLLTGGSLSEHTSSQILAAYGIPVTRQALATSPEEAVGAASQIGYPVVLKVESPDIQHKTDIGGVRLGLQDKEAVADAYYEIIASTRHAQPDARINGVLVQEMLDLSDAVETIVGVTWDRQCGPTLVVGLGGVLVEVLKDVAIRVAPLTTADAWSMLDELRGSRILDGVRGKPAADKQAIVDILLRLSNMVMDIGEPIAELDINPLVVFPAGRGAVAADALIVINNTAQTD